MEDVLDRYHEAYDRDIPLVCMDETSKQLVQETRTPIPMKAGKPARYDFEYERNGVANIFMFCEPMTGLRWANVTERRTKVDWAKQVRWLLEDVYPAAKKVKLVCDNLNTHVISSLYEAFEPEVANRLANRLEIHYTPKHGSWLNIAEIELNAVSRQCLKRRIPTIRSLKQQCTAWQNLRNQDRKPVDWRFRSKDARIKLKSLYPTIQA